MIPMPSFTRLVGPLGFLLIATAVGGLAHAFDFRTCTVAGMQNTVVHWPNAGEQPLLLQYLPVSFPEPWKSRLLSAAGGIDRNPSAIRLKM